MTESEAHIVRQELHEFRDERLQRDRALDEQYSRTLRWMILVATPIVLTIGGILWETAETASNNRSAIDRMQVTDESRASHDARIAVLEATVAETRVRLDTILLEIREMRKEAQDGE